MATDLVALLCSSTDNEYRTVAAVLIRRITFRQCLNPLTEPTLQSDPLSSSLKREQHSSVSNKISGAVLELAPVGEWPELVPFCLHCVSSEDSRLAIGAEYPSRPPVPHSQVGPRLRLDRMHEIAVVLGGEDRGCHCRADY